MSLILAPTLAAASSTPFRVLRGEVVTVKMTGLAGAETGTIEYDSGNGTFVAAPGTASTLTATTPVTSIVSSGSYRVTKTSTASLSGIYID